MINMELLLFYIDDILFDCLFIIIDCLFLTFFNFIIQFAFAYH